MTISGGIKFFDKIKNLATNGATATASPSGNASAPFILDRRRVTLWRSSGSNDATTETITVTLPSSTTFNRLFIVGHNWKDFVIQYDVAAVWTDFAAVVGLDGTPPGPGIKETAFADDTAYYEFTQISTTKIRLQANKTLVVNDEKFLGALILTNEIGTMVGFPLLKVDIRRGKVTTEMGSGRVNVDETVETRHFELRMETYPSSTTYQPDVSLAFTLNELNLPFLIWPCGGKRGTAAFNHTLRGFRLQDVEQVKITNEIEATYTQSIYTGGANLSLQMSEAP